MENCIWPEITAETSMEEIKEIHKRIWDYVIEYREKPDTEYVANCVFCEFHRLAERKYSVVIPFHRCPLCPALIERKEGESCFGGLYLKWAETRSETDAIAIRDIEICTDEEMQKRIKETRENYTVYNEV